MTDRHHTIRLQMHEVYEEGSDFPLFVTSDIHDARRALDSTDRIVTSWWVREGNTND